MPQAVDARRREFVERFATMMVDGGLPRMASRVLALLYTADSRSLTAADLVRELRVSPASISKAIGYLEQVGMVHREPDPRRRLQHYVIAEDVWLKAWQVSARTNLNWAETATEGADLLGRDTPAGERLTQMADFFHRLGEDMSGGPAFDVIDDAFTVLAALLHAARPLTADQLATALDWPPARITDALANATKYAEYCDPVVLDQLDDTYRAIPNPARLTPASSTPSADQARSRRGVIRPSARPSSTRSSKMRLVGRGRADARVEDAAGAGELRRQRGMPEMPGRAGESSGGGTAYPHRNCPPAEHRRPHGRRADRSRRRSRCPRRSSG